MSLAEARCPHHPEAPALGNCQRCGTFFCAEDRQDVEGVAYCASCAVRPDVDWVGAYRQGLWGKRDSWAWFFGFSAVGYLVLTANLAANATGAQRLLAVPSLASAIIGVLFFRGVPIARTLVVVSTLFWAAAQLAVFGPLSLIASAISGAVVFGALTAPRNRLFFKLEVPRAKLKRDYERLADNHLARNAAALGLFSLMVPVIAPIAIVCGVIGARRVNPDARPPVGKKGYAITGIVLGAIGCIFAVGWISFFIGAR